MGHCRYPDLDEKNEKLVCEFFKIGYGEGRVANEVGCHTSQVKRTLKKHGLYRNPTEARAFFKIFPSKKSNRPL
jgi:hypothetical protein